MVARQLKTNCHILHNEGVFSWETAWAGSVEYNIMQSFLTSFIVFYFYRISSILI